MSEIAQSLNHDRTRRAPKAGQSNILDRAGLPLAMVAEQPVLESTANALLLQRALKRMMDIGMALSALIVLSPLLIFVAVWIKSSSKGSVLIRQVREGKHGKAIGVYKFRTMYIDRCDLSGVQQTVKDDPRITPLGKVLRRRNIDELPQLLNILMGDMSVVGPRPHVFGQLAAGRPYRELVPYYGLRHEMRPGLTGWAQAHGLRGPTDDPALARARIEHDLAYIANFSLFLDIKILVLTFIREVRGGKGF